MQKTISCLALSLVLAFPMQSAVAADDEKVDKFTDGELIHILKEEGFSAVKKTDEGEIVIKVNGKKYVLLNDEEGDLQAYYGISGSNLDINYEDMNEWNKTKRFSRAYLDADNDLVLESDLMSDGGINKENVTRFFSVFLTSVSAFRNFIIERDEEN